MTLHFNRRSRAGTGPIATAIALVEILAVTPAMTQIAKGPSNGPAAHIEGYAGPIAPPWNAVGPVFNITNNGTLAGYGTRIDYYSSANAPGFDLATADIAIARATAPNHTAYLSHWFVQVSPLDDKHFWSATIAEMNPVNRGDDPGWTDNLGSLPRFAGGVRIVPETSAFGEPGTGRNIEFAYAVAANGHPNTFGELPSTYNGLMIETNSIAANGRGILEMGSARADAPKQLPESPIEIRANWRQGLTTVGAHFSEGAAIHIGAGQAIALTDDGSVTLKANEKGSQVEIMSHGKKMMALELDTGNLYVAGKIVENAGSLK